MGMHSVRGAEPSTVYIIRHDEHTAYNALLKIAARRIHVARAPKCAMSLKISNETSGATTVPRTSTLWTSS